MPKLTLADLNSTVAGSILTTVNANNDLIEQAIENTLSRDGATPNEMNNDLDMDSNRIINLPEALNSTEPVRKAEFDELIADLDNTVTVSPKLPLAGGTMTGDIDMADHQLIRPIIKDYALKRTAPAIIAGILTLDFTLGNIFEVTLNANITSIVINNWPPTGELGKMTLLLKQDGVGGRTVVLSGYRWPGGAVPIMTTTANKTDIFVLMSPDAGTTIYATTAGQNY